MPLPAFFAYPAAHVAGKTALAVGAEVLPTISSASLAAVLARLAWKRVPEWIKEDVSFQRRQGVGGGDAQEEEECLSSVIEKLQALLATGSAKLTCPVPNLYASILSFAQLSAQLKQSDPTTRDAMFDQSGEPFDIGMKELETLKVALDFATWAYYVDDETFLTEQLDTSHLTLLRASVARRPGSVGHYVAVSHEEQLVVIGVKGTSSMEDLLTDCCGQAVDFNLGGDEVTDRVEVRGKTNDEVVIPLLDTSTVEVVCGHEKISILEGYDEDLDVRCHEGILISAKRLYNHVLPIVDDLVVRGGYRLVLAGHSLGAGAAILLGVLLRSRIPALDNLHVYAFAPPPILDHDVAVAVSPYVTSVVNNSDIVPRWGLANLTVFLEFLRVVSDKLQENGLRPTGPQSTASFLHQLSLGIKGKILMTADEVKEAMEAAHDKVELRHPDHLYVPGKVLLMYDHWQDEICIDGENGENNSLQRVGALKQYVSVSDGTTSVLRFFEIDGYRMLSDHITASYYASIESLMSNQQGKPDVKCPQQTDADVM